MNWKGTKAFGWHKNHASHQKSSIGACYCRERFDGNMPFVLLMVVVVCRSWREMTKGTANMMYGICSYYGPKQSSFTLVIFVPLQISFNELYTYKGCVCVCAMSDKWRTFVFVVANCFMERVRGTTKQQQKMSAYYEHIFPFIPWGNFYLFSSHSFNLRICGGAILSINNIYSAEKSKKKTHEQKRDYWKSKFIEHLHKMLLQWNMKTINPNAI